MLCKRGLCRRAVSVCLSVCLSFTFVNSIKTKKNVSSFFHHRVATPYQTSWRYFDGDPFSGGVECRQVGRNRDYKPISCDVNAATARCYQHGAAGSWQVVVLIAGIKRRSLLMAEDDDEMFVTRSFNVTLKTTEQHLIVRSYLICSPCNQKTLLDVCIIEANY